MKKFSLALLALATALAITPAALADTFTYAFTSNDGTSGAFGTLDATKIGGQWVADSGTGTVFGLGLTVASTITLIANPIAPNTTTSTSGAFNYDDVLLPGANPLITNGGLLFGVNGQEFNIFSNGPGPGTYQAYLQDGTNLFGDFALTDITAPTPEPSSLLLLGSGLLGLAVVLFRKAKPSGLTFLA